MNVRIARMALLPEQFALLRMEAAAEGFHFVDRLGLHWRDGAYDGDAQACVLGAYVDAELAGVGAQTMDEYDPSPAHRRLRHFYVPPRWRRRGVGGALAVALEADAFALAPRLHLRATHAASMAFWDAMGFVRVGGPDRTHEKVRP